MPYKKKSYLEKLNDDKDFPKVVELNEKLRKRWGAETCVISTPREVNEIMKKVPRGKLITINDIRNILAKRHKAQIACPITTGIFASIAAHAAEEETKNGKKRITPYWRTLKNGGVINEKYPGGVKGQKKILKSEGHKIIDKGKKSAVQDFEKKLVKFK